MLSGLPIVIGLGLHLLHFELHATHMRVVECNWTATGDEPPSFDLVGVNIGVSHFITD